MKFCKKCQAETERKPSGDCKPCARAYSAAWRAANPDKVKASNAAWAKANPEKAKAKNAAYRAANPEKAKANSAAWRAANPEKAKSYSAARYADNPEKVKSYSAAYRAANQGKVKANIAAWYAANPEARRIHNNNRRARERNAEGTHTASDIASLMALQKGKCACCRASIKDGYHVDHIMPLSLEGSNDRHNLQLLCPTCNLQKHASHPIDFMQSRGFLL